MSQEALVSSTLAHVYLSQGHISRAAGVIDAVLSDDPLDGVALALRARLQALSGVELRVGAIRAGSATVRWRFAPSRVESGTHLNWAVLSQRGSSKWVGSRPCPDATGNLSFELRYRAGSGVVALARLDDARRFRALAVAELPSWS
jgi:hypothetical protein